MSGSVCVRLSSGRFTNCCLARFATDDLPARIFERLLSVLRRDRFYDVAAERTANSTQSGALFEVAVVRCSALSDVVTWTAPEPTPNPRTTILRIVLPVGTKPSTALPPDVIRLLNDVTRAVDQSKWYGQDVY